MNAALSAAPARHPNRVLPDYLPARMINEYSYCPRLFYYEQVMGIFIHNEFTVEGVSQHKRVDRESKVVPTPDDNDEEPKIVTSITLSSDEHGVIAKLDLAEFRAGKATPVDYKRGRPMSGEDGLNAWPSDKVQLAVQAIVLRANGYRCDEGFVYYQQSRQRVRIVFTAEVIAAATEAISGAWKSAASNKIPPPLVDSPKCPGCSLVGICMPDEILQLQNHPDTEETLQYDLFENQTPSIKKPPRSEPRLLVAPRADLRPLYLNSQGIRVGKSGDVLKIKDRDRTVQEVRINEICQVNLLGNIQISTQAV